jgi:hypothetical protein
MRGGQRSVFQVAQDTARTAATQEAKADFKQSQESHALRLPASEKRKIARINCNNIGTELHKPENKDKVLCNNFASNTIHCSAREPFNDEGCEGDYEPYLQGKSIGRVKSEEEITGGVGSLSTDPRKLLEEREKNMEAYAAGTGKSSLKAAQGAAQGLYAGELPGEEAGPGYNIIDKGLAKTVQERGYGHVMPAPSEPSR